MKFFIRFLLFCARFEVQRINDRLARLYDQLVEGRIDVQQYVAIRRKIDAEKAAAVADAQRWEVALHLYAINAQEARA